MSGPNEERLIIRLYNGSVCCMAADVTNVPFDVLESWFSEMIERGYRPVFKRVPIGRSIICDEEAECP